MMFQDIEGLRKLIVPILQTNGVMRAGIFGSRARNEKTQNSDMDILVEMERSKSLFDFINLKLALKELLSSKVDLIEYDTLKPLIRDSILEEEIRLL